MIQFPAATISKMKTTINCRFSFFKQLPKIIDIIIKGRQPKNILKSYSISQTHINAITKAIIIAITSACNEVLLKGTSIFSSLSNHFLSTTRLNPSLLFLRERANE